MIVDASRELTPPTNLLTMMRPWDVAPDVAGLTTAIANLYFVGPPGAADRQWWLIDAGMYYTTEQIRQAARARYGDARPAAILLTHGHFDHVGGLPMLADEWDTPVYCHPLELPYVTGKSKYPPPDPSVSGMMAFMSRVYPRGPIDLGDRVKTLPPDGTIPNLNEWRWIATPGHSPGHVSFFRDKDRLLIAGDAFVTVAQEEAWAVLSQKQEVRRPPAYFTPDWQAALASVERLRVLKPRIAATGHGIPMQGDALTDGLERLVYNWHKLAIPPGGRYSEQSAITDETGYVSAPRPVLDLRMAALAGIVAGVAFAALMRPHGDD